jgi:hypothetical protein
MIRSSSRRSRVALLSAVIVCSLIALRTTAEERPGIASTVTPVDVPAAELLKKSASDEVTLSNLADREAEWPYQVRLVKAWKPTGYEGEFGWGEGTTGTILRIEPPARLRVDFGRFGKVWVPADATDVVARANQVRIGEIQKFGPNLAAALNHRLLDPSERSLAEYREDLFVKPRQVYVVIFADPIASSFGEIAKASHEWAKIPGSLVVLVALGQVDDAHVYKACYDAGWKGVFLMDRFAPAYAEGYLEPSDPRPAVHVMSPEGRLIFGSSWSKPAASRIAEAARAVVASSRAVASSASKP